jgi:hypothetical protein
MNNKQFEIENFRFNKGNNILVYITRGKVAIPITIPKEQYEQWLLISERMITLMVLNEPGKENIQTDAVMSHAEYWQLNEAEIHADLYDYITTHPIRYNRMVYERSLVSINWGFNNHRSQLN